MNIRRSKGLVAASSVAVLLALVGCNRSEQAANEARQETRQAANAVRQESREAAQKTREAADRTAEAAREAAADTRTAVMGAARETKEAASRLGEKVEDAKITTEVKTGLAVDKDLKALNIDVDTKDGVVTLMGTAPSATAKARAAEIARNVKDVKSVNNQLTVTG